PKGAALRYTLRLVRDQSVVRTGSAQVTVDAQDRWEKLALDVAIDTEEPAELEVWVENKDEMDVYFDDLSVEHTLGPIVQENHFYAYGQRNEGLSWARPSVRGYGRGYQGQNTRFDEETGYDNFELRLYDSRIGRWVSTDPMGQYHSPYIGMGNDPVNSADPDGGETKTDFYNSRNQLVRHVEDGSNAIFYQTGSGANLHYEFGGFGGAGTNFTINVSSVIEQQQFLNNSNADLAAGAGVGGTHCSEATRCVMMAASAAYGNSSAIIPGPSANEMYGQLAKGSGWSETTQNQALAHAKAGGLSVIAYKNSTGGHGHIATYAVGGNVHKYSYLWKGKSASDMGVISNIGPKAYSGSVSIRRSFSTLSTKSYIYRPSR
ncbi:MAG: RHS repeat-associated core domain-containing protein, partial [Bacteroidota bacterium]|nr:RHS repeat-associated core domain-containing protein [Bacteroidota bacterium]